MLESVSLRKGGGGTKGESEVEVDMNTWWAVGEHKPPQNTVIKSLPQYWEVPECTIHKPRLLLHNTFLNQLYLFSNVCP